MINVSQEIGPGRLILERFDFALILAFILSPILVSVSPSFYFYNYSVRTFFFSIYFLFSKCLPMAVPEIGSDLIVLQQFPRIVLVLYFLEYS